MLTYDLVPLSPIQVLSGKHLRESLAQSAPITLQAHLPYDDAWDRTLLGSTDDRPFPVRPTLLAAVVSALQEHPRMNAHLVGDELAAYHEVNIGIMIETAGGVVAPVLRNAENQAAGELADAMLELSRKAQAGIVSLEDMRSATFTVADLGAFGVDAIHPVLPSDMVGVLGVGRSRSAGQAAPLESLITLSLTFDHRAVDSFQAARFLGSIQQHLQPSTPSVA